MKNARALSLRHLDAEGEFLHASQAWDRGELREAFKAFRSLAERGDGGAQLNVGYFFDEGIGVRQNKVKALYWYRRSYMRGHASGANNIATIYRDRGDLKRAVDWFARALKLGEDGAALAIAKIYLAQGTHAARAKSYLKRVATAVRVTESVQEEATELLRNVGLVYRNRQR